jgi:hypothetical protein
VFGDFGTRFEGTSNELLASEGHDLVLHIGGPRLSAAYISDDQFLPHRRLAIHCCIQKKRDLVPHR